MIKVVGKDDNLVKKATCRNCASILEYLPSDRLNGSDRDYTGCTDTYKYIACPACNKELKV